MTTPSPVQVIESYFQALAEGRIPDVMAAFDANIAWHQPGANRFSGIKQGPEAVGAMIGGMMEVSQGSFKLEVTGPLMVNGDTVAVPVHFSGQREGATLDQDGIDLMTVRGGKVVEVKLFSSDPAQEDAFWGQAE